MWARRSLPSPAFTPLARRARARTRVGVSGPAAASASSHHARSSAGTKENQMYGPSAATSASTRSAAPAASPHVTAARSSSCSRRRRSVLGARADSHPDGNLAALGQRHEELQVAPVHRAGVRSGRQTLGGVLADGLEHRQAPVARPSRGSWRRAPRAPRATLRSPPRPRRARSRRRTRRAQ